MKHIGRIISCTVAAALVACMAVPVSAASAALTDGTVSASSEGADHPVSMAVDGDEETYWEAGKDSNDQANPNEWLCMSFADAKSIESIYLFWGGGKPAVDSTAGTATGYGLVEYSTDGTTWNTVSGVTVAREKQDDTHYGDTITWTGGAIKAKAIRINFAAFALGSPYQCWEFEVYGTDAAGGDSGDDGEGGNEEIPKTGVESVAVWAAVLAVSAAAVAFTVKKVRA